VWNAFHYSMAGLAAAYRNEDAFRQEVWLAAVLIPLALWLPASGLGKALMIASVLLVIIVELVNSASRPPSTGSPSTTTTWPSAPRTSAARRSSSPWSMCSWCGAWCCLPERTP
jgi:hypothetical protein